MAFKPSYDAAKNTCKVMVRLSYFKGFEKTASVDGGKLAYRMNGIMMKGTPEGDASIKVVREAREATMKKFTKWAGKDSQKLLKGMDADRRGLLDGNANTNDDGDVREHYENVMYLRLSNGKKPKYKNRDGSDCDEDDLEEKFRSGFWAIVYFHFYCVADAKKGGNGIFSTVDAVQYYKKDEEFSGGGIDDDDIENYGEEDDDDDLDEKPKDKKKSKASSIDDDDEDI